MADETIGITRSKFLNTLREILPPQYRVFPDDKLYDVAVGLDPRISSFKFDPESAPPMGMGEAFWQTTKEQIYRAPEIAASTYNILSKNFLADPGEAPEIRDKKIALRKVLYDTASKTSREWMDNDPSLRNYQEWAQQNPFSWGKFVTDPAMFGRVLGSAVSSFGTIMAAGALGSLGGPELGVAAAFTTAFALGSNEAYGNAYEKAKKKGYSDAEIDRLTAESGLFYGIGEAVLETAVPLAVLRSFGLGNRIAKAAAGKYAAHYLDDAIAAGGKGSAKVAENAWKEFTLSNLSILDRIKTLGKAVGIGALEESATEGTQYLLEQAIVEGKVDGTDIDLDWLIGKIQTPEFNESLAGGLVGGASFTAPTGVRKAYGADGRQAAAATNEIYQSTLDQALEKGASREQAETIAELARQSIIDATMRSNELTYIDKAEYVSLVTTGNVQDAVKNIRDITKAQKPEEPVTEPVTEPTGEVKEPVVAEPKVTTPEPEAVEPKEIEPTPGPEVIEPEVAGPEVVGPEVEEPDILAEEPKEKGNLLKDIIDPTKETKSRKILEGSPAEQVLDHALRNINQFSKEFEQLSEEEQNVTLSLIGNAMEQLAPAKPNLKDEKGNYDRDKLRTYLMSLRKANAYIGVKQEETELGASTLKRQLIRRTPEEIEEAFAQEGVPTEAKVAQPTKPKKKTEAPVRKKAPKSKEVAKETKPKTYKEQRRIIVSTLLETDNVDDAFADAGYIHKDGFWVDSSAIEYFGSLSEKTKKVLKDHNVVYVDSFADDAAELGAATAIRYGDKTIRGINARSDIANISGLSRSPDHIAIHELGHTVWYDLTDNQKSLFDTGAPDTEYGRRVKAAEEAGKPITGAPYAEEEFAEKFAENEGDLKKTLHEAQEGTPPEAKVAQPAPKNEQGFADTPYTRVFGLSSRGGNLAGDIVHTPTLSSDQKLNALTKLFKDKKLAEKYLDLAEKTAGMTNKELLGSDVNKLAATIEKDIAKALTEEERPAINFKDIKKVKANIKDVIRLGIEWRAAYQHQKEITDQLTGMSKVVLSQAKLQAENKKRQKLLDEASQKYEEAKSSVKSLSIEEAAQALADVWNRTPNRTPENIKQLAKNARIHWNDGPLGAIIGLYESIHGDIDRGKVLDSIVDLAVKKVTKTTEQPEATRKRVKEEVSHIALSKEELSSFMQEGAPKGLTVPGRDIDTIYKVLSGEEITEDLDLNVFGAKRMLKTYPNWVGYRLMELVADAKLGKWSLTPQGVIKSLQDPDRLVKQFLLRDKNSLIKNYGKILNMAIVALGGKPFYKTTEQPKVTRKRVKEEATEREAKVQDSTIRSSDDVVDEGLVDEAFHTGSEMPTIAEEPQKAEQLATRLKEQFPWISTRIVDFIGTKDGKEIVGRAYEGAVEWVKGKATLDTLPHEYAHIYVASLRDDPTVKLGIKQFGSEEALVEHIGQYYANRLTGSVLKRMSAWLKQFISKLKKYFGKVKAEDIGNILGEQLFQEPRFPEIAEQVTFVQDQGDLLGLKEVDGQEQLDDSREGMDFAELFEELYNNDPGVMFQRSYFEITRNYIDEETFAKIYEYARENKNLNLSDDFNLDLFRDGIDSIVRAKYGESYVAELDSKRKAKYDRLLKAWFQKANSTTFTSFDRKSTMGRWRDRIVVRMDENGNVMDFTIEKIPLTENAQTGKMEAIDPVSNKAYSEREMQTFVEEDQLAYGIRNKLIYIRMKDSAFVQRGRKLYRASDSDIKLDGNRINQFNTYFARQYQEYLKTKKKGKSYLQFFFAETQGDNSQLFFSAVPGEIMARFRVTAPTERVSVAKIISGGQTGADQAGLLAGKELGISTGGTAPPGFQTAQGSQKELLERFGLEEGVPDPKIYPKRTIKNAQDADGTVWFGNTDSPGARLTLGRIAQAGKPSPIINPTVEELRRWIVENNISVLNVAGNREHTNAGITEKTKSILVEALSVAEQPKSTLEAFTQYLDEEVAKKNISKDHKSDMLETVKKHSANNPYIYHQIAGIHERWKSIAGKDYLMRPTLGGKSVANAWKRLKISTAEGTNPRGVGDSSIMIAKDSEIEFQLRGQALEHMRPDDAGYAYDGMLFTSASYMDKLNSVLGKKGYVYKTYLRSLGVENPDENGEYTDYVAVKSIEMTPPEGLEVYRKTKDGKQFLARYRNGTWRDAQGNAFDRFGTQNEVKDYSGKYNKFYTVHSLPERATRVLKVSDKNVLSGAFPILSFELMLDNGFLKDNPAAQEYIDMAKQHYENLGNEYVEKLYKLRNDPSELARFLKRELQEGELPQELQRLIDAGLEDALYLPEHMKQIVTMINNQFIVNGLYKAKQYAKGKSTYVTIKPDIGIGVKEGNVAISANERVMLRQVAEKAGISPDNKSYSKFIKEINNWLVDNEFYVMIHRQPIQGFTKVVPRRIQEFVLGKHGKTGFATVRDVFEVHEADHDGDIFFMEVIDDVPMIEALRGLQNNPDYKARDKFLDLSWFKKGDLGKSLSNYGSMLKLMTSHTRLRAIQGFVVNAKTMLSTLAYKGVTFTNKKQPNVRYSVYSPTERVTLWYLPLVDLTEQQRQRIRENGDEIVTAGVGPIGLKETDYAKLQAYVHENYPEGKKIRFFNEQEELDEARISGIFDDKRTGKYVGFEVLGKEVPFSKVIEDSPTKGREMYLRTTKEHEFSILLQAAVDHEKFGLFNRIDFAPGESLYEWLLTRIFRRNDGKDLTSEDVKFVGPVYGTFNYGRRRRGQTPTGGNYDFTGNIDASTDISERYFDYDGEAVSTQETNDTVLSQMKSHASKHGSKKQLKRVLNIEDFFTNGQIVPQEVLLSIYGRENSEKVQEDLEDNIQMENPLMMQGGRESPYHEIHQIALSRLLSYMKQRLIDGLADSGKEYADMVDSGLEVGRKMATEYYELYRKIAEDRVKTNNALKVEDLYVNLDYDKQIADFVSKWLPVWVKMGTVDKMWATTYFLNGAEVNGQRHKNVMKLLPSYLMDEAVLGIYSESFRKNTYKAKNQMEAPDVGILKEFGSIKARFQELKGLYCG